MKFIQGTFEEYKQSMERTVQDNLLVIENLKSRVEKDKGKLTEYENSLLEYQDIEKENSEMVNSFADIVILFLRYFLEGDLIENPRIIYENPK